MRSIADIGRNMSGRPSVALNRRWRNCSRGLFVALSFRKTTKDRMTTSEELALTLARSMAEIELKQQANIELFGLGTSERCDVDLETGIIKFTSAKRVVTAPVQVIGTFNSKDDTWLWGWDHPSIPKPCAKASELCREFGERYGLVDFTQRKIQCSQEDAWRFTAVALHLSEGTGSYRGPSNTTFVFMTFGDVTISKGP